MDCIANRLLICRARWAFETQKMRRVLRMRGCADDHHDLTRTVLELPVSTAELSAAGQMLRVVREHEPGSPATLIPDSTQRPTSNQNNPST